MLSSLKKYGANSYFGLGIALVILLLAIPAGVRSQNASVAVVSSGTMIVERKTPEALISGERPFMVTETTKITDATGTVIQLSDILVPCKCKIKYELRMDQNPVCLTVQVK